MAAPIVEDAVDAVCKLPEDAADKAAAIKDLQMCARYVTAYAPWLVPLYNAATALDMHISCLGTFSDSVTGRHAVAAAAWHLALEQVRTGFAPKGKPIMLYAATDAYLDALQAVAVAILGKRDDVQYLGVGNCYMVSRRHDGMCYQVNIGRAVLDGTRVVYGIGPLVPLTASPVPAPPNVVPIRHFVTEWDTSGKLDLMDCVRHGDSTMLQWIQMLRANVATRGLVLA